MDELPGPVQLMVWALVAAAIGFLLVAIFCGVVFMLRAAL